MILGFISKTTKNFSSQIEYILSHKLYNLLGDLKTIESIRQYSNNDIQKIHTLSQQVSLDTLFKILSKMDIQRLSKHNLDPVLEFVRHEDEFINRKVNVVWGPGNHNDINTNIEEHYKKHVLSDEGVYWESLLSNTDCETSCESYKNYAINSFYKMKNVIVHSNGRNAHISGFYGNVFIIGRYHDGVFGISSCYYVENGEKNGRLNNLCFKLDFALVD